MVKQEMARLNVDILRISKLKIEIRTSSFIVQFSKVQSFSIVQSLSNV